MSLGSRNLNIILTLGCRVINILGGLFSLDQGLRPLIAFVFQCYTSNIHHLTVNQNSVIRFLFCHEAKMQVDAVMPNNKIYHIRQFLAKFTRKFNAESFIRFFNM